MPRKGLRKTKGLIKLMAYILVHKPDEFGLVPDQEGFISLKELIQALHEERDWRYVRESNINEALVHSEPGFFQVEGKRIRAVDPHWQLDSDPCPFPPQKVLFSAVRRRAHRHVYENGLRCTANQWIVLSPEREVALRIGMRKDPDPVIIEILALKAYQRGVPFYRFGSLFLAKEIGPEYIGGPLPQKEDEKKITQPPKQKSGLAFDPGAGTFVLNVNRDPDPMRRVKGRKAKGWKEEVRKMRRKRKR